MRFEDSPDLFGGGVGVGTYGDITCEICGKIYDGREIDRGDGDIEYSDESISWTTFAGKQVCQCCYEKIENEILSRMDDILPWFTRILKTKRKNLEGYEFMMVNLQKEMVTKLDETLKELAIVKSERDALKNQLGITNSR